MDPREPPNSLDMAATEAVGEFDLVDGLHAVATMHNVEVVQLEIAMKVSAPMTKMTAI